MKTQNAHIVQTRRCAETVDVKRLRSVCYYSNKCTAIHVDAQNNGANAAGKHKAAAQMCELCEGALGGVCTGRWQGITGAVYRRDDS